MSQNLCESEKTVSATVLWGTRWRSDQKEPSLREAYALRGMEDFFCKSALLQETGHT